MFVFRSFRGYRPRWIRADVVAGLTVWAVLVPESLAYATIAGVPPVVGLYAAVPALLLYLVFGSSRHLVVGAMSATAALSAGIVADLAKGGTAQYVGLTAALAVVTGLIGILAGLLRLGFLASFISEPVLKGFIIGLALTIMVGQLPKLFGVPKGSGDFFEQLGHLVGHLGDTQGVTLAIGLGSLAVVLVLRRWLPIVPGSLVAVVLGVALVYAFDLDRHGVAIVGHVQSGLPHVGLPQHVSAHGYLDLAGPAVGVLLVGFAEGLGAAKTYAAKHGYEVDANAELIGLGAANLGAGLGSGMVVNGSLSKTAVNGGAGARSQLSGATVAVLTVVTLLFLTGLFEKLPEATLAAVVIAAVVELVDIASLRRLFRVSTSRLGRIYGHAARADFAAAVAAMLGVLVFDTLPGLFIGIGVALVLLLYRSSRPNVAVLGRLPGDGPWVDLDRDSRAVEPPGALVCRVESGLYFANSDHVRTRIRTLAAERHATVVVLDAETVPFVDVTATAMLTQLRDELAAAGADLRIARDIGQVRDVLRAADASDLPLYRGISAAVSDDHPAGTPAS
ncbi:SulP family inorganic anion transporter [Actinocatenispora rupis]|uniref:Sodium-independent anion transporter n=1 Tax=Actinocatenispora rupis TaxID=519421 RepID=A0A8J3IYN1_9ACTN|nr:SulP family inorganic anion transporter [Actinocatenispora rupis]GID11063.1 sodium-independent anion transporter [Actinocatenispora rupis]